LTQQKPVNEGFNVPPKKNKVMKFLVSFFALALYFVFALADTAEEITYSNPKATVAAVQTLPDAGIDLAVAATPLPEKAGSSL
jgi:hypothetical protein